MEGDVEAASVARAPGGGGGGGADDGEREEKMCRYCFEGEEAGELIAPCKCAGGQKWVHLACLRRWQRGVLVSQPTHPDFYDEDVRHRMCNVCMSDFTCRPPTRLELMQSFTGEELAALVEERCIIGSHRDFSEDLRRQLRLFPGPLQEGMVDRHWIDAAFLIVKVAEDGATPLTVKIGDQESIVEFVNGVSDDWCWQVRGRNYRLLFEGPLEAAGRCGEPAARREELQKLRAPVKLKMVPAEPGDCGEDGVVAVNLTRPVRLTGNPDEAKRRRRFEAALRKAMPNGEPFLPPVAHFLGGPCLKDEAQFAIVVSGPEDYEVYEELPEALKAAQARVLAVRGQAAAGGGADAAAAAAPSAAAAGGCGAASGPPAKRARRAPGAAAEAPPPGPLAAAESCERERLLSAAAAGGAAALRLAAEERQRLEREVAAQAEEVRQEEEERRRRAADGGPPCRVLVFWGTAGWSRCQLMGELASGSWGLCRSEAADVASRQPHEVYEALYPRLVFAPKTEMSETYNRASAAADEAEAQARLLRLRRQLRQRQLQLDRELSALVGPLREDRLPQSPPRTPPEGSGPGGNSLDEFFAEALGAHDFSSEDDLDSDDSDLEDGEEEDCESDEEEELE